MAEYTNLPLSNVKIKSRKLEKKGKHQAQSTVSDLLSHNFQTHTPKLVDDY